MPTRRDFYRILHVQPDAPAEIIRTSYRTLMQGLKMHPDLGGDHGEAALINEAFATLKDPAKRAAYDRLLAESHEPEPRPADPRSRPDGPAGANKTSQAKSAYGLARAQHACAFCGEPHSAHDGSQPTAVCWHCESPLFPAVKQPRTTSSGRSLDRAPRNLPVTIRLAGPAGHAFPATTEDISINGARFRSDGELVLGQRLKLDCAFCTAVGVVRHVQAVPDRRPPQWHIGVEFVTLLIKQSRGVFVSTQV